MTDDDRTMMVRYREWARQPKVIVTVIAVMSMLFIGYGYIDSLDLEDYH